MPAAIKPEIYLFRHAHDIKDSDDWIRKEGGGDFTETLPDGTVLKMPWKRLSPEGEGEANAIRDFVLRERGNALTTYPIEQVIVKNPEGYDNSQNTFYTAWPLIQALNSDEEKAKRGGRTLQVRILGYDGPIGIKQQDIVKALTDVSATYSTVVCLDAQSLWGFQKGANGKYLLDNENNKIKVEDTDAPEDGSYMGKVGSFFFKDFIAHFKDHETWSKYVPYLKKGGVIYKFDDKDNDSQLDFSVYDLSGGKLRQKLTSYDIKDIIAADGA